MASPTFGAAGTYLTGVNASTAAFAVPTGAAADEIMVVGMYLEGTAAVTPPTGFTQKSRPTTGSGGSDHDLIVFWKRCTGADSGTYSFSWTGGLWREGACVRISGCVTSGDPFNVVGTNASTTAGSGVTPASSNTTTVTDTLQLFVGSNFNGGAWTPPSGYTERVDNSSDLTVATLAQATAGASGSITATCAGGSASSCSFVGALKSTTSVVPGGAAAPRRPLSRYRYLIGR